MPKASREQKTPVGSRWQAPKSQRVFVVVERKPFGRLVTQEEGRAYFGYPTQQALLANFIRLPDNASPLENAASSGILATFTEGPK